MRFLRCSIPILVAALLTALSFWRTDFFSAEKIRAPLLSEQDLPPVSDFEWPQTFRYIGRGRQCFAFESPDGKYVLKFFDRTRLNPPWQRFLPRSYGQKEMNRWIDRVRIYPESYRLALEKMAEETGLLAVHQGASSTLYPTVEIVDKASRRFFIDLNKVPFVLQKKGLGKFLNRFSEACSSGGPGEMELLLEKFLAFHAKRISLFIADGDHDIKRNYAWEGDTLLCIDPARFFLKKEMQQERNFRREWWGATYRLRKWISQNIPEKLPYFDEKVRENKQKTALPGE